MHTLVAGEVISKGRTSVPFVIRTQLKENDDAVSSELILPQDRAANRFLKTEAVRLVQREQSARDRGLGDESVSADEPGRFGRLHGADPGEGPR